MLEGPEGTSERSPELGELLDWRMTRGGMRFRGMVLGHLTHEQFRSMLRRATGQCVNPAHLHGERAPLYTCDDPDPYDLASTLAGVQRATSAVGSNGRSGDLPEVPSPQVTPSSRSLTGPSPRLVAGTATCGTQSHESDPGSSTSQSRLSTRMHCSKSVTSHDAGRDGRCLWCRYPVDPPVPAPRLDGHRTELEAAYRSHYDPDWGTRPGEY
jgi:hypothetical protein